MKPKRRPYRDPSPTMLSLGGATRLAPGDVVLLTFPLDSASSLVDNIAAMLRARDVGMVPLRDSQRVEAVWTGPSVEVVGA